MRRRHHQVGFAVGAMGLALAILHPAHALEGVVVRISDGDTLWVRTDQAPTKPIKIRIEGIDAPERCQAWGAEASAALRAKVFKRRVVVVEKGRDNYGRLLADVLLGDEDVSPWMIREGHAWSYRHHGNRGRYDDLEAEARGEARGLFAQTDPMMPYVFRRIHGPCPDK